MVLRYYVDYYTDCVCLEQGLPRREDFPFIEMSSWGLVSREDCDVTHLHLYEFLTDPNIGVKKIIPSDV